MGNGRGIPKAGREVKGDAGGEMAHVRTDGPWKQEVQLRVAGTAELGLQVMVVP